MARTISSLEDEGVNDNWTPEYETLPSPVAVLGPNDTALRLNGMEQNYEFQELLYDTENHTEKSNHTEKPLKLHWKALQKIITLK